MTQIILDSATGKRFRAADGPAQICDADGQLLGYFTPAENASVYEGVEPPTPTEELLRRADAGGGRTWREIKADLEKLP